MNAHFNATRQLAGLAGLLFVLLAMMSGGCASSNTQSQTGASGIDLTTESDEPEARKRARIRTELAAGYFEQGQTSVALDEIKQALLSDPNYAPALSLRGLAYMRISEPKLAEESFRRALQINPRDADVAHNFGWMLCQQGRNSEAIGLFTQALSNPSYAGRSRTLLAQGVCRAKAGQLPEAELDLTRSFELDAGNPVTAFSLAQVLFRRDDLVKAQFYLRRLNNGEMANAETLWLGIKVENKLGNQVAVQQLADQLKRRFPKSKEFGFYERGALNE